MASPDIVVSPVGGKSDLKAFIDLPKRLYAGHPGYIAHLNVEKRRVRRAALDHADDAASAAGALQRARKPDVEAIDEGAIDLPSEEVVAVVADRAGWNRDRVIRVAEGRGDRVLLALEATVRAQAEQAPPRRRGQVDDAVPALVDRGAHRIHGTPRTGGFDFSPRTS